ncbi:MAG: TlpA family protein disulfide reductase [Flavobacteriaceae bacterium]|jgi:thiol-disulfide isomerase/thioredoxin|nr:TlpA family protein disulfide reductase [Flavobacteriaceae bacterium]MBT4113896.1 TlpA family protein disulfide reductase [Flavobacteriaceae bacterium]MBT4613745.1 TlpA family protein disulfide reductase [Flavobacteriaceae bacterium]MBT5246325.1 TlpA family protein disulfide reductase [Flavobacteriaceae bacterium]MBT5650378.1 TlpA family protein disulfide reductase [Flavobacteriaceae bacterium]
MRNFIFLSVFLLSFAGFSQKTLPNINLKTFEGDKVNVADLTSNDKIAILSLWATWCVPCIKELDAINELYDEWKTQVDFEVYAISVDDSRSINRAKALVNGKGWEHNILLDTNHNLKRSLGASAIPVTIIVRNNKILYQHTGYRNGDEYELFEKLKTLSKE